MLTSIINETFNNLNYVMDESTNASVEVEEVRAELLPEDSPLAGLSQPKVTSTWFGQTRYDNPWDTWREFGEKLFPMIKWKCTNLPPSPPRREDAERDLPIVKREEILEELKSIPEANQVRATWLGHASVLLQVGVSLVQCDRIPHIQTKK